MDPKSFLDNIFNSMPKDAANEMREAVKKSAEKIDKDKKIKPEDLKDGESLGFSPADMMALFSSGNRDPEILLPYLRTMYKQIGSILERYEKNSSGNTGESGK